jgi:hypothetical protein
MPIPSHLSTEISFPLKIETKTAGTATVLPVRAVPARVAKKHQSERQKKRGLGDEENRVVTRAKEKSERHIVGREKCRPFLLGF